MWHWVLARRSLLTLRHRDFLRTSATISIAQDGTKGRLLTRFVASNRKLEVRRGIAGLRRDFGTGHQAILSATRQIRIEIESILSVDSTCLSFLRAASRQAGKQIIDHDRQHKLLKNDPGADVDSPHGGRVACLVFCLRFVRIGLWMMVVRFIGLLFGHECVCRSCGVSLGEACLRRFWRQHADFES